MNTVPICRPCFRERYPGKDPVRVIPSRVEVCHFCDQLTTLGIYVMVPS